MDKQVLCIDGALFKTVPMSHYGSCMTTNCQLFKAQTDYIGLQN